MALGGITAGLNVNTPSGTSSAGLGDSDIRSIKTTFQQVIDSEHHFPSTGGAGSGAHRLGSARAFYGASSAISSSDTDGRLYIDSTNSRLHHVGSSNTMVLGGQYAMFGHPVVQVADFGTALSLYTSGVTQRWVTEVGVGVMIAGSSSTAITLFNTFARGVPIVCQGVNDGGVSYTTHWPIVVGDLGASNSLTVRNRDTSGAVAAAATYNFTYMVSGYVAL